MIATLEGVISDQLTDMVVVTVGGVGYGVLTTAADGRSLRHGETAKFYIHENIKEDAHDLFGFLEPASKHLFEQLLTVKNIGPKSALALLDIGTVAEVQGAIAGGDVKKLQTAKGIGKRAAEQAIVELRDKVGVAVGNAAEDLVSRGGINASDEAVQALIALGYSDIDARQAVEGIDAGLDVEERVRQALSHRSK